MNRSDVLSRLRWFRYCAEWRPRTEINLVPRGTRGLYTLLKHRPRLQRYDVVYVGIASGETMGGVRSRLQSHARSRRKSAIWTHFSVFAVWPNVPTNDLRELEGLLRHIYRRDNRANRLNRQRSFGLLRAIRRNDFGWGQASPKPWQNPGLTFAWTERKPNVEFTWMSHGAPKVARLPSKRFTLADAIEAARAAGSNSPDKRGRTMLRALLRKGMIKVLSDT